MEYLTTSSIKNSVDVLLSTPRGNTFGFPFICTLSHVDIHHQKIWEFISGLDVLKILTLKGHNIEDKLFVALIISSSASPLDCILLFSSPFVMASHTQTLESLKLKGLHLLVVDFSQIFTFWVL